MQTKPTSGWKVHKFGGTSVLNAERFRNVAEIILRKCGDGPKAVVVSAMKGVTDDLIMAVELARQNQAAHAEVLARVHDRHRREIESLFTGPAREGLLAVIDRDIKEIGEILRGIWLVRAVAPQTADSVAGMGEVWSAQILNALFRQHGIESEWLDARQIVTVRAADQRVVVEWAGTRELFATWKSRLSAELVVATGFVARREDGTPATLGRNGSDFSATIFGDLFASDEIFIWTDVDGVLSADPRRVPDAIVLDEMSYDELSELAYFGAKVVHPSTMAPAMARGSTVWIKNSFNPDFPGTRIHKSSSPGRAVKGFSTIDDMCLVNLEGPGMTGIPGVAERLFGALRGAGVSVTLISQASSEHSICLALPAAQAEVARAAIEEAFALERQRGFVNAVEVVSAVSILAAVGDNMAERPGVAGDFFTSLGLSGVNVRAIAQGSSERNISAVIDARDSTRALRAVHSAFVLPRHRLGIGLIGPGLIGSTFLRQLSERAPGLKRERDIDLQVLALADSKRMLLAEQPIAPQEWKERLEGAGQPLDLEKFARHLTSGSVPHNAVIDATASADLVSHYGPWLQLGLHVITPNKKANAGPMEGYLAIRAAARRANRRFLYSTNVGAGLPIIQTLRDLRATGDEVLKIQGVLSGTLSYLFSSYDGVKPFSAVLAHARDQGYTEPDPREDLSGQDVARKTVILAREAGFALSLDNVRVESLVPEHLRTCTREEFIGRAMEADAGMAERLRRARANGKVLRFLASVNHEGEAVVGLIELPTDHAFARVTGTDNIVSIQTKRYFDQPLIVQGPGAGPEVTAAGVFADLLRLASYLGAAL